MTRRNKIQKNTFDIKKFHLNFGPQHPAAHGVLRLILHLNGETIKYIDPHIGLLHRGTEKLIEQKTFFQALPYFDRLDYVSTMSLEHCYSLGIEKLFDISIPIRASYIRVLFVELTRILNHLMAITTHALDLGAITPFLWGFEEREKIMELFENVSGARLHCNYLIPGGLNVDLPLTVINNIYKFLENFLTTFSSIDNILTNNLIWKYRLQDIGKIDREFAKKFSFSGVLLRSTGVPFDIRKNFPYEIYQSLNFYTYTGRKGDCYDRYYIRLCEMRESVKIIYTLLNKLPTGNIRNIENENILPFKKDFKNNMELMIRHYKLMSKPVLSKKQSIYSFIEAPKGEFGIFYTIANSSNLWRCRIKAPGFFHLQSLDEMSYNLKLADLVAIIGTQDIVFGEIDR